MNIDTSNKNINEKKKNVAYNLEDEITIDSKQVQAIVEKVPEEEPEVIAELLTIIERSRESTCARRGYKRFDDKDVVRTIILLLQEYTADNLAGMFEELKYYELKQIFESGCPAGQLRELI